VDSFWYGCWAGAERPWLEATIDPDDSGLSLIVGTVRLAQNVSQHIKIK
jgi:hypothetical protein